MNLKKLDSINYKKIYDENMLFASEKMSSSQKRNESIVHFYFFLFMEYA